MGLSTGKLSDGNVNAIVAIFISESKNSSNRRQNLKGKDLQMPEIKNALAELAKRLRNGLYIDRDRFDHPVITCVLDSEDVLMAQRIVAELAKVEDRREGETNSDALCRCNDCIAKCRVIAEE